MTVTKLRALVFWVALLTCISTGSAYLAYRAAHNNRERIEQSCRDNKKLSDIEHDLVFSQELQNKALLAKGFTFGIPPKELPLLVRESEETNHRFLRELDLIAKVDCSEVGGNNAGKVLEGTVHKH